MLELAFLDSTTRVSGDELSCWTMMLPKDPSGCPCCYRRVHELRKSKEEQKGTKRKEGEPGGSCESVFVNK